MILADRLPDLYHSPERRERRSIVANAKPWGRDVLDIPITFYVHMSAITEEPTAKVVGINAHAILARQRQGSTVYHIDCLDWAADSCALTYQIVSERAIKITILRGLMLKLREMDIDPQSIRGWSRWVEGFVVVREMDLMGLSNG